MIQRTLGLLKMRFSFFLFFLLSANAQGVEMEVVKQGARNGRINKSEWTVHD